MWLVFNPGGIDFVAFYHFSRFQTTMQIELIDAHTPSPTVYFASPPVSDVEVRVQIVSGC